MARVPARTGLKRSVVLPHFPAGSDLAVVGSKGGMPTHPLWYRNLEAKPECDLKVGAKSLSARARVAEGAERELREVIETVSSGSNDPADASRRAP